MRRNTKEDVATWNVVGNDALLTKINSCEPEMEKLFMSGPPTMLNEYVCPWYAKQKK